MPVGVHNFRTLEPNSLVIDDCFLMAVRSSPHPKPLSRVFDHTVSLGEGLLWFEARCWMLDAGNTSFPPVGEGPRMGATKGSQPDAERLI